MEILNRKKPNEPWRTTMVELMELGFCDYEKNEVIVSKHTSFQNSNIDLILDELYNEK